MSRSACRRLKLKPETIPEVSEALAKVGLCRVSKRRMPQALSGGERQRVAFARALVRNRPFLLLDEAFASLDEELRRHGRVAEAVAAETGMMVLMISHDRREIVRLAESRHRGIGWPQCLLWRYSHWSAWPKKILPSYASLKNDRFILRL
jgi:ABC-type thiamine transport system ATPase subunit